MRFIKDPANLRYSLNIILPLLVFLICILSSVLTINLLAYSDHYPLLLIAISALLAFVSFVVVFSMTAPVKELVRKAEGIVRLDNRKGMRGQLREVYETIEGLIEHIKTKEPAGSTKGLKMAKDIERLDYIIPLGYMSLVIAHEVRNPLSTIRGMCELLLNRLEEGKERLYVESIFEATKRIDGFTRELLDFTDIEPVMTEFDLSRLIRDAVEGMRLNFDSVTCELACKDNILFFGDRDKIYQSISNVIRNAFEYERDNGYVRIDVKDEDPIVISVFNKGSRIDDKDKDLVFKPFYTTRKEGKGIGLFVALKNAKLHGGAIDVSSTDKGTTFKILLPRQGKRHAKEDNDH